jgi:hypothetical protein
MKEDRREEAQQEVVDDVNLLGLIALLLVLSLQWFYTEC